MRDPKFWVANRNGNVFTATANDRYIQQLTRTYKRGVRIKRIAASHWCAWAIGHDHRVYIFVLPSDVPIRVPETTYENQRWSPFNGFHSSNLLPTDRQAWSDENGDYYLPKESIRLPSAHWAWEGEWFIDENLQGEICTDRGGWQYAVNFTSKWTAEMHWNSCVRKRKWIRFRRFTTTSQWATISDIEVVDHRECFIDLAVGGQLLPGQSPDFLSVWAVTNNGQVYVRKSVCRDCPEGTEWILLPSQSEGIINISCGPTGLVWAITWDGHAIVRTHVSRDAVYGQTWEIVPYPEESTRLMQVSVGRNSVWAISREGKVWFRQGVNGDKLIWDAKAATGNSWVLMVGEMAHISVSANDQVFALSLDNEEIWFRTGVTPSEPGGKIWQLVALKEHPDIFSPGSVTSLTSEASPLFMECQDEAAFTVSGNMDASNGSSTQTREVQADASPPRQTETTVSVAERIQADSAPHMQTETTVIVTGGCDVHAQAAGGGEGKQFSQNSHPDEISSQSGLYYSSESDVKKSNLEVCLDEVSLNQQHSVDSSSLLATNQKRETVMWQVIENSLGPRPKQEVGCQDCVGSLGSPQRTARHLNSCVCSLSLEGPDTVSISDQSSGKVADCEEKHVYRNAGCKANSAIHDGDHLTDLTSCTFSECSSLTGHKSECRRACGPGNSLHSSDDLNKSGVTLISNEHQLCTCGFQQSVIAEKLLTEPANALPRRRLSSLESYSSSDSICNFVTDLIEDNGEVDDSCNMSRPRTGSEHDISSSSQQTVTFEDLHSQGEVTSRCPSELPSIIPWISLGRSETFTGKPYEGALPLLQKEDMPMMMLTPAQPRYCWGWLSAADFVVDNPATVSWLRPSGSESQIHYQIPKISKVVRDKVLEMLKIRNHEEVHRFQEYEQAVEKTSWVKKASMKIRCEARGKVWRDCTVELEQGVGFSMDGTLTIQYDIKQKQKTIQISLQDIRCIKMCDDHCIAMYTTDPHNVDHPLLLKTQSEAEAREWMGMINVANAMLWGLNQPILPGSIWSVTIPGHIFVHIPGLARVNPSDMMWGQHGGHMEAVETNRCGVTWALSFDQTPFVYNGGYGNILTREISEMASDLREQVDYRTIYVYENQKWFMVAGYCSRGIFKNNFAWTTPKGKYVQSRSDIKLPSSQWQWVGEWMVDFSTEGGVSNEGWQYASSFSGPFHPSQRARDTIRRRRWFRKCKLVTQGPWVSVGPPELSSLSLQVDRPATPTQPIVLWAIGANGDVLCRDGITQAHPMGTSWIHVATTLDKPFQSVSVGGKHRVWAVAQDGSVWYRPGVTPYAPAGSCWIQVVPPPPGGLHLCQISVGGTAVWAVDTSGSLWRREEITPTFPEGTHWTYVCNHVRRVSVGPHDEVWIVSDANFGQNKRPGGAVYRRLGISETVPSGTDWDFVIGPGWHYVTIRGTVSK